MATLKDYFQTVHNLQAFIKKYSINTLVETGTGLGDSVDFCKDYIHSVISFEICAEIYQKASERFKYASNVYLVNKASEDGIVNYVSQLPEAKYLFFLDAHFPGADFGLAKYEDEKNEDIRIPLKIELETIVEIRQDNICQDCFIIDDLRVYEDGEFEAGNWEPRKQIGGNGIDFIYDMFSETHYIEKDYRFQGFVLLTPMGRNK